MVPGRFLEAWKPGILVPRAERVDQPLLPDIPRMGEMR